MGRPNKTYSRMEAGQRLSEPEFRKLYADEELYDYIVNKAGQIAGQNDELSSELRSEAWLRLATCDAGRALSWYKEEARRAIDAAYKRHTRDRARSEDVYDAELVIESYNEAWAYHNGYAKNPQTPMAPGSDGVNLRGSAADDPIAWRERPPQKKRPWYER